MKSDYVSITEESTSIDEEKLDKVAGGIYGCEPCAPQECAI